MKWFSLFIYLFYPKVCDPWYHQFDPGFHIMNLVQMSTGEQNAGK